MSVTAICTFCCRRHRGVRVATVNASGVKICEACYDKAVKHIMLPAWKELPCVAKSDPATGIKEADDVVSSVSE